MMRRLVGSVRIRSSARAIWSMPAPGCVFATENRCPHKGGPLSEGIVHGESVTCPLHGWVINLRTGLAEGADSGCVPTVPARVEDGKVLLDIAKLGAREAA